MCPILSEVGFANLQCPDAYTLMNCPLHHCPASFGFFSGLWLSTPVFTHIPDSKLLPLLCLPCTSPSTFFLGFPLWSLPPLWSVSQQLASYLSRFASVNESKSDRLARFTVIPGDVTHWASESREAFGLGDWEQGSCFFLTKRSDCQPSSKTSPQSLTNEQDWISGHPFSGIFLVDGSPVLSFIFTGTSCMLRCPLVLCSQPQRGVLFHPTVWLSTLC